MTNHQQATTNKLVACKASFGYNPVVLRYTQSVEMDFSWRSDPRH